MKKYLVFAGDRYYPSKAFGDFKAAFESYEEACKYKNKLYDQESPRFDWTEIVDLDDYIGEIN